MAFSNGQDFGSIDFGQGGSRANVQTNTSQQPSGGGGGWGGFLGDLMGLGATVTSFIPGAQVAAPFLAAGSQLMDGNFLGAAKSAGSGMAGLNQTDTASGGEGETDTTPSPEDVEAPEITHPKEEAPDYVDPAFSTQQEYDEWWNQFFTQNPALAMQMYYENSQIPGTGFGQFT